MAKGNLRGLITVLMVLLAGPASAEQVVAAAPQPASSSLLFRDLFGRDMAPSPRAQAIAGSETSISLLGFAAPSPIENAPYLVLVGAPAQFCPYCSVPEDQDQMPYLLVYPEGEVERFGQRVRLKVVGKLEVGLAYDEALGLPNAMRIRGARVVRDQKAGNPSRQRLPKRSLTGKAPNLVPSQAPEIVDPTEIDG